MQQTFQALVDLMMSMFRDDELRSAFEADPEAVMADRGLSGVTKQDVCDARLVMSDGGGIAPRAGGSSRSSDDDDDPIREIFHTTKNFELKNQTFNLTSIDDRDTVINDSFNEDSFNTGDDNSVDNVLAIDDKDTTINQDNDDIDVVNIEDSLNDEPAEDKPAEDKPAEDKPADDVADGPIDTAPVPAEEPPAEPDVTIPENELSEPIEEEPDLDTMPV